MNQEVCPHCGARENVVGVQEGYSSVRPAYKLLSLKEQALYHVICAKCGTVIRSYVENPEKLKSK